MSGNPWRLIDTGFSNGYINMAIDEVLMLSCKRNGARPTLRFYQWKPSALSIGYSQRFGEGFNVENCRSMGVDIVRRLTGGQAVFHDGDLTYSVTIPETYLQAPRTEILIKMISLGLKQGLNNLGIEVNLINSGRSELNKKSYNCFLNKSNYEIGINGKKLVGSAQRRTSGALLQHGAIMIKIDYNRILKVFGENGESDKENIFKIGEKITSLSENMEMAPNVEEIKKAIISGFEKAIGISLVFEPLSAEELYYIEKLTDEKYSKEEWNEKQ